MLRIRVPALPGGTFHGQIGDVAGQVAVDIAVQRDLLRADQCTVIVIEGQWVLLSIVIEIYCYITIAKCTIIIISISCFVIGTHHAGMGVSVKILIVRLFQPIIMRRYFFQKAIRATVSGLLSKCRIIILQPIIQILCFGR